MAYQTLLSELTDGILTITINRPDKLNALNRTVLDELDNAFAQATQDNDVHAIILTGSGPKAFVAGADISAFMDFSADEGAALARHGQEIFRRLELSAKPLVAAINGFALGGGCELAMSCHFRIAADNAKFGQPEVNLGLIPGYGGTQRLTRLVGRGRATELMMTGSMIDAPEAWRIGLVNHVVPADGLMAYTRQILQTILSKSPKAIARLVEAVDASEGDPAEGYLQEARLFGACFGTREMKEGVTAFLEKRKPAFR
jgi:enoyl-CoA hydratase